MPFVVSWYATPSPPSSYRPTAIVPGLACGVPAYGRDGTGGFGIMNFGGVKPTFPFSSSAKSENAWRLPPNFGCTLLRPGRIHAVLANHVSVNGTLNSYGSLLLTPRQ